jgi:hypothetical protein
LLGASQQVRPFQMANLKCQIAQPTDDGQRTVNHGQRSTNHEQLAADGCPDEKNENFCSEWGNSA